MRFLNMYYNLKFSNNNLLIASFMLLLLLHVFSYFYFLCSEIFCLEFISKCSKALSSEQKK